MSAHNVEQIIFNVSAALLVPVLILALLALALVIYEAGSVTVEMYRRRRRSFPKLERATAQAKEFLGEDDRPSAAESLKPVAQSASMAGVLEALVGFGAGRPGRRAPPRRWPTSTTARCGGSSARGCWCAPARRLA